MSVSSHTPALSAAEGDVELLFGIKPKSCRTVIGTNHPWLWIPASMPE